MSDTNPTSSFDSEAASEAGRFFKFTRVFVYHHTVEYIVAAENESEASDKMSRFDYKTKEDVDEDMIDTVDGADAGPIPCYSDGEEING
jgi:hypothetical protein